MDEDIISIQGFTLNKLKFFTVWSFIVLSGGIVGLILYWFPEYYVKFTHSASSLNSCEKVIIRDKYNQPFICDVLILRSNKHSGDLVNFNVATRCFAKVAVLRFFSFKRSIYIWQKDTFQRLPEFCEFLSCRALHTLNALSAEEQSQRLRLFDFNCLTVKLTPLLTFFFKEALSPFYIFQIFSLTVWYFDKYEFYACFIFLFSIISIFKSTYDFRKSEKIVKKYAQAVISVKVLRSDGTFEIISSKYLVPGDVIEVSSYTHFEMPCDAVLLSGSCVVNESSLSGESVPVNKMHLPVTDAPFNLKLHNKHILYCGTQIIQSRVFQGSFVKALVLRTSFQTLKGNLMKHILFPKPTLVKFYTDSYKYIQILVAFSMIGFVYSGILHYANGASVLKIIVRSLDIITIVVPPALPLALTVATVISQSRLKEHDILCLSSNSIIASGAINFFCFDKTGTLTHENLDILGFLPLNSENEFCESLSTRESDFKNSLSQEHAFKALSSCHSITQVKDELVGDPIDIKMFYFTKCLLQEARSSSSQYDFDAIASTIIKSKSHFFELSIFRELPFLPDLQRMSVVCWDTQSNGFLLYCKGSPEIVSSLSSQSSIPKNYHEELNHYTSLGYRIIALAYKSLSDQKVNHIQKANRQHVNRFILISMKQRRIQRGYMAKKFAKFSHSINANPPIIYKHKISKI